MKLKFLGRDTGFGDVHTSAYFTSDDELVIIDCPVSTFQKLKHSDLSKYKKVYFLITHTHGDHIGGLGLTIQYFHFVLKKKVTIIAPSILTLNDITTLLKIEGVNFSWYKVLDCFHFPYKGKKWSVKSIFTTHSPNIRCFGYRINLNGHLIVYTGDTNTLSPYIPVSYENYYCELYVDTCVSKNPVHLNLEESLPQFLKLISDGCHIYLMHLDDANEAQKLIANFENIEIVSVIDKIE